MTEVTQSGEKVFELLYEGSDLESYRAFRFPLNDGLPNSQITKAEVLELNTYEFKDSNKIDPGISIKINAMASIGYNELTVKNYAFAPFYPKFSGKAPLVIPRRIVLSNIGITSINANIRFDINNWGVTDPANTIIYYRSSENDGLFVPLETTYNFVTGKLTADINGFGEYIIAKPDLESQLLAPIPNFPDSGSTVNYKLPVQLTWSPAGFAGTYSLQVSYDENFTNLLIDETSINEAKYNLAVLLPNTKYYWHVKTQNDAGDSPWCVTQSFTTVNPFILIKEPNGGERWHIGLEYYIKWDDNITEPVTLSLLRNDALEKNITATGNSFYLWEVGLTLTPADNYKIQIVSTTDTTLFDISDATFSIIDTVTSVYEYEQIPTEFSLAQNYPNPFNPNTSIKFSLPTESKVILTIYNSLGQEITKLIDEVKPLGNYSLYWYGRNLSSGVYIYKMEAIPINGSNLFRNIKKMILLK